MMADCCVEIFIPAEVEPVLTIDTDDIDPFTGETMIWPSPRIYWSNGMITDGNVSEIHAWRCAEHEQGTNLLDRDPWADEVCWGFASDPEKLECRWVHAT